MKIHFSKKVFIPLLIFFVIAALVFAFFTSPPRSWSNSEPPGWPNRYPETTLSGMVAASNRLAFEVWVTPPVYARAVAYASAAYWDAYRANSSADSVFTYPTVGSPSSKAGVTAYSRVFSTLVPTPATERFKSMYDTNDVRGVDVADSVIAIASSDGYSENPLSYRDVINRSGVVNLDKNSVWLPVYNSGTISEPDWGSVSPILQASAECVSPPPNYSRDFLTKEGNLFSENYKVLQEKSLYTTYVSLFNAYAPSASGLFMHNISFSLYNILINLLEDSGVTGYAADKLLLEYNLAAHDTYVIVYKDKYKYKVPAIQNFHSVMTMHVPHAPSYPAIPTALTSLLVEIAKSGDLAATPRLEVPGAMPTPPWNRVLGSVENLNSEIEAVFYVAGYGYTMDLRQGKVVGECIFKGLSKDKF